MSKQSNKSNVSANKKAIVANKEENVWNISEANAIGNVLQNFKELAMVVCYERWFKGDKTSTYTANNIMFDSYYGVKEKNGSEGIISQVLVT
jgi:hypothetical protein